MITVGIDPGIRGAIAFLDDDGSMRSVEDLPTQPTGVAGKMKLEINPRALSNLLRAYIPKQDRCTVVMEDLNVFAGGSAQSIASLFATKAVIRAVFDLNGWIGMQRITPQCWQKFYGIKNRESEDTKKQSLRIARTLYGMSHLALEKHDGRADALLIARWAYKHLAQPQPMAVPIADPLFI